MRYKLYRITLNSLGDGTGSAGHEAYDNLPDAIAAADRRWEADNCRPWTRWTVLDRNSGGTLYRVDARLAAGKEA